MSSIYWESTILFVKEASLPQPKQMADNFVIVYAFDSKLRTVPKGFFWNVASRAAIMTNFPLFASISATSTMSGKN